MGDVINVNFADQHPRREAPSVKVGAPNYKLRRFLTLGLPTILAVSTGLALTGLAFADRESSSPSKVQPGCELVVEQGQTAWYFASQIGKVIGGDTRIIEAKLPDVIGNPADIADIQAGSVLGFPADYCPALAQSGYQLLKH
jgi:hypothetical protein